MLKNVLGLLDALRARGVKLYLASGTDQADVAAEAEALGYAGLFEGRIFGAVGDIKEFHNIVIGYGSLPLEILEQLVDKYIAEDQSS